MIAAIENAVLERLENAEDDLGYSWRTLETYPDDFDAYLKDKVQQRCPAAWCVFLGLEQFTEEEDYTERATARFALVVAAQNLRNETATRHGGGGEPGSYQLASDAIGLLAGSMLGLDINRIEIRSARLIGRTKTMREQKLSMMAVEFSTQIAWPLVVDNPEDAGSFEQFHVDWDVPPFGGVGPVLPDDDADASDSIALEGDSE